MQARHIIFFIFVASAIYVYFRGKVRFGVVRSLTDYQVLLAPINALLYLFSKVKAAAFIPVNEFPEMKPLDRKSTRLNSSHIPLSRMPSSA